MVQTSSQPQGPWLRAVDRMILSAVAALAAVAGLFHPRPLPIVASLAVMAVCLVAIAAAGRRFAVAHAVHAFFPLPAVIVIFNMAGPLIGAANPARWDAVFAAADLRIFGPLAPAWRAALARPAWLTDLASILYFSYYVIPVAMAAALYARRRQVEFDELTFGLIATLLSSYVGYFLFPTTGPRIPEAEELQILGGGAVSAWVRAFLRVAEVNQLDAFPSGHTALSLVFLYYGWRMFPRFRVPLVGAVAGIIFATVYLSLHYVVDLCAGAALAAAMTRLVPVARRAFGEAPGSLVPATYRVDERPAP
jgi:membrane-associated phospholipid phosphatase